MEDELYDEVRRSRLGRGARVALFAGVLAVGLLVTTLHLTGVLTPGRRFLLGPVVSVIGLGLLVMELRRR
jgi:hypothetical protein